MRFWIKTPNGNQVLSEESETVVSNFDPPLENGFTKQIISEGSKGYQATAAGAVVIQTLDGYADIYYKTASKDLKISSISVKKELSQ